MSKAHRVLPFWVSGLAIGIALSVLGLSGGIQPSTISALLFVVVSVIVTLGAARPQRSLFDSPIYLAVYSYVLFIGIGPLLAPLARQGRTTAWALTVSWIGLAALAWGYWLGKSRPAIGQGVASATGRDVTVQVSKPPNIDSSHLFYGGMLYTVLGTAGVILYLWRVGGLGNLLSTPYGYRENPPIYETPYDLLRPGLFLMVAWAFKRPKLSGWVCLFLFVYTGFDLVWFGPVRGSRHYMLEVILPLACLMKFAATDRSNERGLFLARYGIHGLAAAGILAALAWGSLRIYSIKQLTAMKVEDLSLLSGTGAATAGTAYSTYDAFDRIVDMVPRFVPYQWGGTFYESSTIFIPRKLWPSKPMSVAAGLTEALYGSRYDEVGGNSSPTWPGELYLDFGAAGVMLGLIGMGIVFARLARWGPAHNPGVNSKALLYAISFALPLDWVWGGSNTAIWYLMTATVPVYAFILLARLHLGKPAPRPIFLRPDSGRVP